MSTAEVTPNAAPAASAAPDTSSAPASTPAAASSTPTSTPVAATPAAEPTVQEQAQGGKSFEEIIGGVMAKKSGERQAEPAVAKPAEITPAPAQTEEEKLAAAAAGEQPKPGEEKKDEPKPAEATPGLDLEGDVSTKWLDDQIKAGKVTVADESTRGVLFKMARELGDIKPIAEIFPDLDTAKMAAEAATQFEAHDQRFLGATTPEGADAFLQGIYESALERDEQGNPVKDQSGRFVTHPAYDAFQSRLFEHQLGLLQKTDMGQWPDTARGLFNTVLDNFRTQAEKDGNDTVIAAVDALREVLPPPSQATEGELPPAQKQYVESVKQRDAAMQAERQAARQQASEQFNRTTADESTKAINALIEPALLKAALPEFSRNAALDKIQTALLDKLEADTLFQSQLSRLKSLDPSPEVQKQIVAKIMGKVNRIAGPIVQQVLREAAAPVMAKQAEAQQKQAAQEANSRVEPKGASISGVKPMDSNPAEAMKTLMETMAQENGGRRPSMEQVLVRYAQLKQQARNARA